MAWSPDGKYIASGVSDGSVQVWEAFTKRKILPPIQTGHTGYTKVVNAVAWSPDGAHIASGSSDQTVQVWIPSQTATETSKYSGHTDVVDALAWSPNGQHLASGSLDKTVRVWELASSGSPYIYRAHTDAVYTIAWSPSGLPWPWSHEAQRLASGGKDMTVRLWQAV